MIPALVLAREFCRRDSARKVLFCGTQRGIETRLVPAAGFPLELLDIGKLQGQSSAAKLKTLMALPRAVGRAGRILDEFRPHLVLGLGGYASGPAMLASAVRGTPVAVFEPNAYPGLVNRWTAPFIHRAFVGFEEATSYFAAGRAIVTGVPVRSEFFGIPPTQYRSPFTVLVFGGSQGARSLNRAVLEALPKLDQSNSPAKASLLLIHQTGETEYNRIKEEVAKHSSPVEVFAFLDRMAEAFARADLIVCRAGAGTVAELAAAGRSAILVPLPGGGGDQLHNARALERVGAARLIPDRDLNGDTLWKEMLDLLGNPQRLRAMEQAMRSLAHPHATTEIVNELEKLGSRSDQ